MKRTPAGPYTSLEENLMVIFALLEGMADVEEARSLLSAYLKTSTERNKLPVEYETFLIRLYFDKCHKEFQTSERDLGE
ncbi:MAG TPA: hypothetical protein VKZ59_13795 [Acidobacteriota bacterium]|nr:hypothetical protein [Acidobacteriota bacterium]